MKVRQVIVWEVDVQTIDDANEVVMAEFSDPRDGGPVMEWYEMDEIGDWR